jgi:hypothetical protein
MSLTGQRSELAEALSTVQDVNGFKYRTKTMNTGDAWGLIERLTNPGGMNHQVTWRVVVVLPPNEKDSSEWFDSHYEEISDVLNEQFGFVEEIELANLQVEGNNSRPAALFTVIREA